MFKNLLVVLLLASTTAQAEMPDWFKEVMKVPNPNELPMLLFVPETCKGMSQAELLSIAEGVFVRSRIKPLSSTEHVDNPKKYPIYLNVRLDCFGDGPLYHFMFGINFGQWIPPGPSVLLTKPYGNYGSADTVGIKGYGKRAVERAITDYVKLNFNL